MFKKILKKIFNQEIMKRNINEPPKTERPPAPKGQKRNYRPLTAGYSGKEINNVDALKIQIELNSILDLLQNQTLNTIRRK